jgi:murein DD-endopeptidase MepM/ murein hydrolase activator NlpD
MSIKVFPLIGSYVVCSGYGPRGNGFHNGIDLCQPNGSPIVAVDDGTVSFGTDPMGGMVAVLHATDGRAWYHAHLSAQTGANRSVKAGEQIGEVGDTGNASSGPTHLHIELWPTGKFQRPAPDPTPELMAAPQLQGPVPAPAPIAHRSSPLPAALGALAILGIATLVAWSLKPLRPRRSRA